MLKQIFYLGDIHGNFEYIKGLIKRMNIGNNKEVTYILQVGDFGIGFNPKSDLQTLELLNKFFKLRNIIFIAIRGNHDNPEYFKGNHIYSNLKLVEDYTVLDIHDTRHLFVGGAISIDRIPRKAEDSSAASYGSSRKSYWVDEKFNLDESKLENIYGVDVVITHSAPEWCFPDNRTGFGQLVDHFAKYDDMLYHDLTIERRDISRMFEILNKNGNAIREHYYGHFHNSQITMNGYTNHYLVNINEFLTND